MENARKKVQQVLARTDTSSFDADDWRKVLDCCGGCPPELITVLQDLQAQECLDAKSFLDAIFPKGKSGEATEACALRVIQVTDVYILDNFPSLRTLIQEKEADIKAQFGGGSCCISMLTGDFLAPYLLSSIDRGVGMIRMLNETPIQYVTWGNHEADLSHEDVMCRVEEYQGVWINSNMQSHESFRKCVGRQKAVEVIELPHKRVGLIGVLSNETNLYKPGAFGGATIDDPWETLAFYKKFLEKEKGCDLVLPLCHLYENQDEITCRNFDFPVILSGHDHHIVDRVVDGTRILKPGSDAHHAVMLDIIWDTHDSAPRIEVELLKVADFVADATLAKTVKEVYSTLDHLRYTHVVKVPASFQPLSSMNSRGCCTSAARFICSEIRCALNLKCLEGVSSHCDCVLINGGNFRGERQYETSHLSLEDLMSEIDESVEIVVAELPGSLLKGALRETWRGVSGAWMQHDDLVEVNSSGEIIFIAGAPLNLHQIYRVGSTRRFGIQLIPSVASFWQENPHLRPNPESAVPVHSLLLHFWAEKVWVRIWAFMDQDRNGSIDSEEMKLLDRSGDGELDRHDIMCAVKTVADMETFDGEYTLTDLVMKVAGQCGQGCQGLTLKEINHRRHLRRKQLRTARTREARFPSELLPDAHVQGQNANPRHSM